MKRFSRFLLSLLLYSSTPLLLYSSVTWFDLDYYTDFCNPERGFYHPQSQKMRESSPASNLTGDIIINQRNKYNRSLILREYYFGGYRADTLPPYVLDLIRSDFDTCRTYGAKMVIRFAYTDVWQKPYNDSRPNWWRIHLEQLKPVLAQGEDVIACVQAGFLGVWGEWYYSSQGEGKGIAQSTKNDLINELLDAVPASRAIQLRTPEYKQSYLNKDTVPLTPEEAFSGTPKARLGHHNDAILNGKSNMGTYKNRTKEMSYLNRDCRYLPIGGETDLTSEQSDAQEIYNEWSTGVIAHEEFKYLHLSYLNYAYSTFVISKWRKEYNHKGVSYYDIISAHLGYRFGVQKSSLPDSVAPGGNLPINLIMANTGYATPYNERHAYLVLKNETDTLTFPLNSDPRFWASNELTLIDEKLQVPADAPEGIYDVCLFLPDFAKNLAKDSRFAIRLCNEDCWEETSGYNNLHVQIKVSSEASSDPQIEPIQTGLVSPYSSTPLLPYTHKTLRQGRFVITTPSGEYSILGTKL